MFQEEIYIAIELTIKEQINGERCRDSICILAANDQLLWSRTVQQILPSHATLIHCGISQTSSTFCCCCCC